MEGPTISAWSKRLIPITVNRKERHNYSLLAGPNDRIKCYLHWGIPPTEIHNLRRFVVGRPTYLYIHSF